MNRIFFEISRFERTPLKTPPIPRVITQLSRFVPSIAPSAIHGFFHKIFTKRSVTPPKLSFQPPRYFAASVSDHDKNRSSQPFFYLLTETNENPRPRLLPNHPKLLRMLCHGQGILRQNMQGLTYLDIDNQFIMALLPYITRQGLTPPPHFNALSSPNGAHIPVIPSREARFRDISLVKETGQIFSFEIEGYYSVEPASWPGIQQIWFFRVHSPELERLRRKYFLPAIPGGHPFVIANAVQPNNKIHSNTLPTMRISPTAYAA